jgi:hypothetical protein
MTKKKKKNKYVAVLRLNGKDVPLTKKDELDLKRLLRKAYD